MTPRRTEILGVPVDCVTMSETRRLVRRWLASSESQSIMAMNPEKVMAALHNPSLLHALMQAGLLVPDGIGAVLAVRSRGVKDIERVPGSEVMPVICKELARLGGSAFLYGGAPEVNDRAATVLVNRFHGLKIVGQQHGFLDEKDMPGLIARIRAAAPDVLFVALGTPKQELWMDRYGPELRVKIMQGVGGTFDVLAGRVKRAPQLACRWHLEWLYRLVTDPRRARRQAVLPRFAFHVLQQRMWG